MFNFEQLRLGLRVRVSQHKDAGHYIIKRIDTEQRIVFIVPAVDNELCMQWVSGEALYKGVL